MMKTYYYYQSEEKKGLYTKEELDELYREQLIDSTTMIHVEGSDEKMGYEQLNLEIAALPALPTAHENACWYCNGAITLTDRQEVPAKCPHCNEDLGPKDSGLWTQFTYAIKRYFSLKGRATRYEFWLFHVMCYILAMACFFFGMVIPGLGFLLALFLIVPNFTIMVRRFHDVGVSGKWVLVVQVLPAMLYFSSIAFFFYTLSALVGGFSNLMDIIARIFDLATRIDEMTGVSGFVARGLYSSLVDKLLEHMGYVLLEYLWVYLISFLLVPIVAFIVGLIVSCMDSQPGVNKYGISRKYPPRVS